MSFNLKDFEPYHFMTHWKMDEHFSDAVLVWSKEGGYQFAWRKVATGTEVYKVSGYSPTAKYKIIAVKKPKIELDIKEKQ